MRRALLLAAGAAFLGVALGIAWGCGSRRRGLEQNEVVGILQRAKRRRYLLNVLVAGAARCGGLAKEQEKINKLQK
jgi:hypothetical protein